MEESKTYCLKDYKNEHCWQSIGVIVSPSYAIKEVLKCSQCQKVILETREEITLVYQVPDNLKDDKDEK